MILFPYAAETQGGSVRSSFLLIEELVKRGRAVTLAFHGEGFASDLAARNGFPFVILPPLGRVRETERKDGLRPGNFAAMAACLGVLRRSGATLVHVNDKRMLRTWALPALLARRPLVNHWRSVYTPSLSVDLGLRIAKRTLCVSHYSREKLPAWARPKAATIYNPFQTSMDAQGVAQARAAIRAANDIPPHAAVIGFFGTLQDRKRAHVVLKILQRIERTADGRPVVAVICGGRVEPHDRQFFQMMQDPALASRVVFPGFVPNPLDWMAACDVLVAPAVHEPLARVGVEAQSIGLPALVSSDGGLKEVVDDGRSGFVIPPDDFDAWLRQVRLVLDDAAVAAQLREGGFRQAARLTVERHTDAVEAVYAELLPAARPTDAVMAPGRPAQSGEA